jgi:hypothetical protein
MKDLMQKVISFITFEFALENNCLSQQFNATHVSRQKDNPYWSTTSTRQKIIARYWYELVLGHFTFLFGVPAFLFLAASSNSQTAFGVVFVVGLITYGKHALVSLQAQLLF